jgi:hypothetical protein
MYVLRLDYNMCLFACIKRNVLHRPEFQTSSVTMQDLRFWRPCEKMCWSSVLLLHVVLLHVKFSGQPTASIFKNEVRTTRKWLVRSSSRSSLREGYVMGLFKNACRSFIVTMGPPFPQFYHVDNNDLVSHYCSNYLCDVIWRAPLMAV